MKKLLLILMLSIFTIPLVNGQVTYPTTMYRNWTLVGTPSWTTTSFYYCVTRSTYPNANGQYFYDVWFTSNTYTWDYYNNRSQWRYVQINGCKVIFNGRYSNGGVPISFSFIQNYTPTPLRFISTSRNPSFKIYWDKYYTL